MSSKTALLLPRLPLTVCRELQTRWVKCDVLSQSPNDGGGDGSKIKVETLKNLETCRNLRVYRSAQSTSFTGSPFSATTAFARSVSRRPCHPKQILNCILGQNPFGTAHMQRVRHLVLVFRRGGCLSKPRSGELFSQFLIMGTGCVCRLVGGTWP